jgi:hypothetical protein
MSIQSIWNANIPTHDYAVQTMFGSILKHTYTNPMLCIYYHIVASSFKCKFKLQVYINHYKDG